MGAHTEIDLALNARMDTLSGTYNIAWENATGIYTEQETWLSVFNIPTLFEAAGCGEDASNEVRGIYQILLYCPKGRGSIETKQIVDSLSTLFIRGLTLTSPGGLKVKIRRCVPGAAFEDRGWYVTPISVYYHTYTENE